MLLELVLPDGIAGLCDVKTIGTEFLAKNVGARFGHLVEEIDEHDVVRFAIGTDIHVGEGNVVGAACKRAPTAVLFVDGQKTLDKELGLWGLLANGLDEADDLLGHVDDGSVVYHVVDARHEENGTRLMGRDLAKALSHANSVVANDATVNHMAVAQALAPVLAVLCQTVAQHDDALAGDAALALELRHALVVVGKRTVAHVLGLHR